MASLNFPSNPTEGQEYTANGTTWKFTNDKWIISVPEPVVTIDDLSDATSNNSVNSITLGFGTYGGDLSGTVAVGHDSLTNITSGLYNTTLGHNVGTILTTGGNNVLIGNSVESAADTSSSVGIGVYAEASSFGVAVGYNAGNPAGSFKTTIGHGAGVYNTGNYGIAIGYSALRGTSAIYASGNNNISIGYYTGFDLSTGDNNVMLGSLTGANLTTGSDNVLLGGSAGLSQTIGQRNVIVGTSAADASTTGSDLTILGNGAATDLIGANNVIAIGRSSASSVTSGSDYILIGKSTGTNLLSPGSTVAIGNQALRYPTAAGVAGPQHSVVIGANSATNVASGNNIIVIGANSQPSATNASDEITLGSNTITRLRVPGLDLDTNDASDGEILAWNSTNGGFVWTTPTSISGLATETYVDNAIADLANSAPATLDTLNELAAALGDDANFSTTVTNSLAAKANTADLAAVATSGSYNDLSDTPSIPVTTTVTSNGTFLAIPDAAIETYYGGTSFAGNPDRQYIAINSQFAYSNTYPGGSEVYGAPNAGGPQLFISAMPNGNGTDTYANMSGSIIIGGGNAIDATPGDQPGLRATIVGIEAMASSTYPQYSTAIGYRALNRIGNDAWNTVVGMYAAAGLTDGSNNTIVGHRAGADLDTAYNNVIVGANAQSSSNTSNNEITLGNVEIERLRVPGLDIDISDVGTPAIIKTYSVPGDRLPIAGANSIVDSSNVTPIPSLSDDKIHLYPIVIYKPMDSWTINVNCSVAEPSGPNDDGGSIRLGLYKSDGDWGFTNGGPKTLLGESTRIYLDTTGKKSSPTFTQKLYPGTYYLAMLYNEGTWNPGTAQFGETYMDDKHSLNRILGMDSNGNGRVALATQSGQAFLTAGSLPSDLENPGFTFSGFSYITNSFYRFPGIYLS